MNLPASVGSLQICPGHRKPMRLIQTAEAVENVGLKGDLHAIGGSERQVLLIERETLDRLGLGAGDVKENITTVHIDLMSLRRGKRMLVGAEVILEITKACSPCSRMEEIRAGLLREIAGNRGMLARVVKGGAIHRGDAITLLDP